MNYTGDYQNVGGSAEEDFVELVEKEDSGVGKGREEAQNEILVCGVQHVGHSHKDMAVAVEVVHTDMGMEHAVMTAVAVGMADLEEVGNHKDRCMGMVVKIHIYP